MHESGLRDTQYFMRPLGRMEYRVTRKSARVACICIIREMLVKYSFIFTLAISTCSTYKNVRKFSAWVLGLALGILILI